MNEKKYIQVTDNMNAPETRARELAPLQAVQDNYEKIVIAMDCDLISDVDGIKIVKMDIEGKDNYADTDAYIGEINGKSYDATTYIFPKDKSVKKYTVEFDSPVEHTLTFTPKVKQCILAFTLYTDATSSIAGITVDNKLMADTNIYDLSGRVVAQKGSEGLKKGIYIFNNKKFVVK